MRSRLFYYAPAWVAIALLSSCSYNDINKQVDCSKSDLAVVVDGKINPTQCLAIDGSITVSASGGQGPYIFSINGGSYQSANLFSNLGPGLYTVNVKGVKGCEASTQIELMAPNTTLSASYITKDDSDCLIHNGSIKVTGLLGKPPYKFQFKQSGFTKSSTGDTTINNLPFGNYTITIKDSDDCPKSLNINVARGNTGISYSTVIKPILDANCNVPGCHNGDLGSTRDWRNFNVLKDNSINVKSRTSNKSMPPIGSLALTKQQIDQIACWVDDGATNN
jgi:SprB repeat